jgi:negative regulator of genetic competence, sporulation and motility
MEINNNRSITLFLSDEELNIRGFEIEKHEKNIDLINELVDEALLFAESTHGFDTIDLPYKTEFAYVPSQGAYITITFKDVDPQSSQPVSAEKEAACYQFEDFEHLVACSHSLPDALRKCGQLIVFDGKYVLGLEQTEFAQREDYETVLSFLGEFGMKKNVALHLAREYGKVIFAKEALHEIAVRFVR